MFTVIWLPWLVDKVRVLALIAAKVPTVIWLWGALDADDETVAGDDFAQAANNITRTKVKTRANPYRR